MPQLVVEYDEAEVRELVRADAENRLRRRIDDNWVSPAAQDGAWRVEVAVGAVEAALANGDVCDG